MTQTEEASKMASLETAKPETELIDAHDQITAVLDLYVQGASTGDPAKMREAFHPLCRLWGSLAGERHDITLDEFCGLIDGAPANSEGNYRGRVTSVVRVGDMAVGTVSEDGYWGTISFTAYFSLARIQGRWWIVNKTFEHTGGEPPAE
jgi:hypothetical protein